jgi:hypothetical protein
MPSKIRTCEDYRTALVNAAAARTGGSEPPRELRSHLGACASCCATFTEEQQLFAAIDSGVYTAANAEMPASLLPRVRAALETKTSAKYGWLTSRLLLAGAAIACLALFASLAIWRHGSRTAQEASDSAARQSVPSLTTPKNQTLIPAPQVDPNATYRSRTTIAHNRAPSQVRSNVGNEPEVLVPQDQEVLLVSYAEEWHRRKRAPLVTENSAEAIPAPLKVAPIQIAQLDVKLLAEEKPQ